jgi:hypothetical protein
VIEPYADADKRREVKRESARRRRLRERVEVAVDPYAAWIVELREQAAAGSVIAEVCLRRRFGIDIRNQDDPEGTNG